MHFRTLHTTIRGLSLLCLLVRYQTVLFAQPSVTSTYPVPNATRVPGNVTIAVTFSEYFYASMLPRPAWRVLADARGLR